MKAFAAIVLFLAVCGLASATTLFKRQDACAPSADFLTILINECPAIVNPDIASPQVLCSDNCAGRACDYYKSNDFPSVCIFAVTQGCHNASQPIPSACGAVAFVTFKGVLAAVLLLAAFLIF